jgi:hypothetical protein
MGTCSASFELNSVVVIGGVPEAVAAKEPGESRDFAWRSDWLFVS